jgi:hypothetical protein
MMALACLWLAQSGVPAAAAQAHGHTITWLAAGDSYSSGQGLPHRSGPCARAVGPSKTWAQVAQQVLASQGVDVAQPDVVACSGAKRTQFLNSQGSNPPEWTARMKRVDLVTLTFGGNTVDFETVLIDCFLDRSGCSNAHVRPNIAAMGDAYPAFLGSVANNAVIKGGNVVVMGYPELVETPTQWPHGLGRCQYILDVTHSRLIRGFAGDLNATLGEAVARVNDWPPARRNDVTFTYIDPVSGNDGVTPSDPNLFEPTTGFRHELCSKGAQWLNGLGISDDTSSFPRKLLAAVAAGASPPEALIAKAVSRLTVGPASFHPNQAGNIATGNLAAEVIAKLSWPSSPVPTLGIHWNTGGVGTISGWGTVKPAYIHNGGDPTSVASNVVWQSWGGPQALATGTAFYVPTTAASIQTGVEARASIVAFDPGTCGGHYAYHRITWYFPAYGQSFTAGADTDWQLCPPPWWSSSLTITPTSLGPVHLGQTVTQAQTAAGGGEYDFFADVGDGSFGISGGSSRQHLYVENNPVTCIGASVATTGPGAQTVTTPQGFALGGTVTQLLAIYGKKARYIPAPTGGGMVDYAGYVVTEGGGDAFAFVVGPTNTIMEIAAGQLTTPTSCPG